MLVRKTANKHCFCFVKILQKEVVRIDWVYKEYVHFNCTILQVSHVESNFSDFEDDGGDLHDGDEGMEIEEHLQDAEEEGDKVCSFWCKDK